MRSSRYNVSNPSSDAKGFHLSTLASTCHSSPRSATFWERPSANTTWVSNARSPVRANVSTAAGDSAESRDHDSRLPPASITPTATTTNSTDTSADNTVEMTRRRRTQCTASSENTSTSNTGNAIAAISKVMACEVV